MKRPSRLSRILVGAILLVSAPIVMVIGSGIFSAQTAVTKNYVWKAILPVAPSRGSEADLADIAAVRSQQSLIGTPRWEQAKRDISFDIFTIYTTVYGPEFNATNKPEFQPLFAYASAQLSHASRAAKANFDRPRPFVTAPNLKLCTDSPPQDGSYPSGHAAWGWLSAHILAQLDPARADIILARGRDFGQSRIICGVHYPSDVIAGRMMGDAVLAALEKDPTFKRLLAAAK
jgi:acid phosphatase (class A)